jgi:hypothetical protein
MGTGFAQCLPSLVHGLGRFSSIRDAVMLCSKACCLRGLKRPDTWAVHELLEAPRALPYPVS